MKKSNPIFLPGKLQQQNTIQEREYLGTNIKGKRHSSYNTIVSTSSKSTQNLITTDINLPNRRFKEQKNCLSSKFSKIRNKACGLCIILFCSKIDVK